MKSKTMKLPKYLKLNKGNMWLDDDAEDQNASGIRLIDTDIEFIGRGYLSSKDMDYYEKTGITPNKPIKLDIHKNQDATHNSYGYVVSEKDRSYFCTEDIPEDKLANILTAWQNNILIPYDPKTKKKNIQEKTKDNRRDFSCNKDGDMVFSGKNKDMYNKLNNLVFNELKKFVTGHNKRADLQDMLQYEVKGYNKLSRPRGEVMDLIRTKINELGPGITPIRVNDIDDQD